MSNFPDMLMQFDLTEQYVKTTNIYKVHLLQVYILVYAIYLDMAGHPRRFV